MTEPSSENLARELDKAGFRMLAARARRDEFHDFKSPHAMPEHELVAELRKEGGRAAKAIAQRVINGEFDATKEESDAWMASPEGQEAMRMLLGPPDA
jgi:hypothetical protein